MANSHLPRIALSATSRSIIGGVLYLAGLTMAVLGFALPGGDPLSRVPWSLGAGVILGVAYQVTPSSRQRERGPDKRWYGPAIWASIAALFAAAIAAGLHWQLAWTALLTVSTAAFAIYLSERFPAGGKWPGVFLLSVVCDALMVFQFATRTNGPELAILATLFVPALAVAVTLTVWAFMVRTLQPAEYTKATEVARGVLCAWLLLIVASAVWSWLGIKLGSADSFDPLRFAIPLVTFGSVIATATTGWTRFREGRAQIIAVTPEQRELGSPTHD